jgi:pyruvate,orthophosphate dikinase
MGRVCLVGCRELSIDLDYRKGRLGDHAINEGDWISLDGNAGEIILGHLPVVVARPDSELAEIERWRSELGPAAVAARR